ncbi:MAG: hypothetical protein PVI87_00685 [Gammaproteobacteria bacterium]|jgi:hypothetical protein
MALTRSGMRFDPDVDRPRPWRRRQRDIAYVGWSSFLMACAASAVFFAAVDPEVLSGNNTLHWEIGRQAGYAIGFFGFWLLTAATATFVLWLVRTEGRNGGAGTRRPPGVRNRHRRRGLLRRRARPDDARDTEES